MAKCKIPRWKLNTVLTQIIHDLKLYPTSNSNLPKILKKAETCTTRKQSQKLLKKVSKLTRKVTITADD